MRGHKRFKDGSWRLIADTAKDPMTDIAALEGVGVS